MALSFNAGFMLLSISMLDVSISPVLVMTNFIKTLPSGTVPFASAGYLVVMAMYWYMASKPPGYCGMFSTMVKICGPKVSSWAFAGPAMLNTNRISSIGVLM